MKLSIYACMCMLTIPAFSYGMDHENAVTVTAAIVQNQQKDNTKKANTQTAQEVCRLTLYALAEKRLGAKK